jgi:hypothetical protein
MNKFILAAGTACFLCAGSAFAQSNSENSNAAIAQNFQFINHPPAPPAPASVPAGTRGMRGHGRQRGSMKSDSADTAPAQP